MAIDYTNIETFLASYVNSPEFTEHLYSTLHAIERPEQRFKAMLDLMDYIRPKYKTIDAPSEEGSRDINVTYVLDGADDAQTS